MVAKFPICLDPRIHLCAHEHLGDRPGVSGRRSQSERGADNPHSGASYGLINGGPPGMIYTYLGTVIGMCFVVLSMAEMASM